MPTADDIRWFKQNFGTEIDAAVTGLPFDVDMITAIACQETGYIWATLRRKALPLDRIVALCVGDTIDAKADGTGRRAFPRNKEELLSAPNGQHMFRVARAALEDMAAHIDGYKKAATNPDKFCRGFGVFQYDLQFYKTDPEYFLEKKYERFPETLAKCLRELRGGLKKLGYGEARSRLTDLEFARVAIVYNTGGYNPAKGLEQGHSDGTKHYGRAVYDYLSLSRASATTSPLAPGHYRVTARDGLKLRGGPGTDFGSDRTLAAGTVLSVITADSRNPVWVSVAVGNDTLIDGYVHSGFLEPA